MKKSYGRLLEVKTDTVGRQIHLFLNIYKHIINYHNKVDVWAKHWMDIIQTATPKKVGQAWFYTKLAEGLTFQIRVINEKGIYLIKTAIISKGCIGRFKRRNYV